MLSDLRLLARNWRKNHRHQGGMAAALRCLRGTRRARAGEAALPAAAPGTVDVLTFSVVPALTVLWHTLLCRALAPWAADAGRAARVVVGDGSGGLPAAALSGQGGQGGLETHVLPCLNAQHGEKLDLFLRRVCAAEHVLICDDDIFWLDGEPLRWALEHVAAGGGAGRTPVASLVPRERASSVLEGEVEQPMGSHCLLLHRPTWLAEGLSFRVVHPPATAGYDWFYDTADHANVELLRRGYTIALAPEETRRSFAELEAMSTWVLKLREHPPDYLAREVAFIPLKREKALRAALAARALEPLLAELPLPAEAPRHLLPPRRAAEAAEALARALPAGTAERLAAEVDEVVGRLRRRLG